MEIRKLEEELSEAAKGAERINELLAAYFGKDDLRVVVSAEKRFQIVRGSVVAKNMSEGEKTAIAFTYPCLRDTPWRFADSRRADARPDFWPAPFAVLNRHRWCASSRACACACPRNNKVRP